MSTTPTTASVQSEPEASQNGAPAIPVNVVARPTVRDLLRLAVQENASDVHVGTGKHVRFRVDGRLKVHDNFKRIRPGGEEEVVSLQMPGGHELKDILCAELTKEEIAEWETRGAIDKALMLTSGEAKGERFRCNFYLDSSGAAAAFRWIPADPPSLDELGHPEVLKRVTNYPVGLILVTGPTGSGKSTTIAAMLRHINENRSAHIMTIEDPIEYLHTDIKAMINQREVRQHTASFADGLREALRQDPDIVLVGEMRDPETTKIALDAAETGHLVFSTVHTQDAPQTVDRILGNFSAEDKVYIQGLLSNTLRAVVTQSLVPRDRPEGGRVAALEVMITTPAVANNIREKQTHLLHHEIVTKRSLGMQSMEYALADLLLRGVIDVRAAVRAARRPKELESAVKHRNPELAHALQHAVADVAQTDILNLDDQ